MEHKDSPATYLHGFSKEEQARLREQARFAETSIYRDIDFSSIENLLEVGMGVGAQTEILLRRFPEINITGIEKSPVQIENAESYLKTLPWAENRFKVLQMDAETMELDNASMDAAFLCWVLEVRLQNR